MGEVDAFSLVRLKCYFGPNDHYPQHFEVYKRGAWTIRVFFLRSTRKRGLSWEYKRQVGTAALSRTEEAALLEHVLKHKRRLLREWNEKVCPARER